MSRYALNDQWIAPQTDNAREIFRTLINPLRLPKDEEGFPITELTVSGSYGNGKSYLIAAAIHMLCIDNPGLQVLIVRQELSSLNGVLLPQLGGHSGLYRYGFRKSRNNPIRATRGGEVEPNRWQYRSGSTVVTAGLDRPGKRLGGEYDIIWVNQSEQVSKESWMKLGSRLRNGAWLAPDGTEKYLLIGDANPGGPTHFLKLREEDGRTPMVSMNHMDNPGYFYNGEWTQAGLAYVARLKNSLEGFELERGLHGEWVAASGLVYPKFSHEQHVRPINFGDIPRDWLWYGSIDYGFSHAGVYNLLAVSRDRGEARRHIAFKSIYKAEMTIDDLYREIQSLHQRYGVKARTITADHRADSNETLRRKGLPITPANKDILEGVDAVKRVLNRPDGLVINSQLLAHKPCPRLKELGAVVLPLREFQLYCYPPEDKRTGDSRIDDKPLKGNDDWLDTLRYHIADFMDYMPGVRIGASRKMPSALPNYASGAAQKVA